MHRPRFARALGLTTFAALAACGEERVAPASEPRGDWPVTVEPVGGEEHQQYDRVVLVTIDTLRADHVSCYGYPRATTPFLDSLAARGVRFARAIATVSHTAPSHATMLTGLVPAVHGVLHNGENLDASALDLARLFGTAGYETAAFLNVQFLTGIAGSFGHVEVRRVGNQGHNGADVVDAALAWLEKERKGPRFLLWVHLYDPHDWRQRMYADQGRQASPWSGATPAGFSESLLELHGLGAPAPEQPYAIDWGSDLDVLDSSLASFERAIDEYDELARFADRQLERLHERLEALCLPGRTLWIVTSDHGEGLASHKTVSHGTRIYQEQLRVPLVLHASDGSVPARVVDEPVSHVDLFATLAETLGLRVSGSPGLYEGRSLWPLVRGEAWPGRALFSQRRSPKDEKDPDRTELYALQTADSKFILHEPGPDEFFDLARDPRELSDLGADVPAAAELRAALEERLRLYRTHLAPGRESDVPEDRMQELRDLGYAR